MYPTPAGIDLYQRGTVPWKNGGEPGGRALPGTRWGAALLALGAGAALLVWPAPVTESVRASILYCLTGLAPSLFPFLALTSFVVRSGAGAVFGRGLGFLARHVFRLPACCAAPILLSWVGGYPAGARAASLLLGRGEITEGQAARMMLFCVNPGAAFVVTYLGGAVLHSVGAGWLLFAAVTLGSLFCGVLAAWGSPIPPKNGPVLPGNDPSSPGKDLKKPGDSPGGALVAAVSDASAAVLRMCACIVLFAGGSAVLRASGVTALLTGALAGTGLCSPGEAQALLAFLLEVTGGGGDCRRIPGGGGALRLWAGLWGAVRPPAGGGAVCPVPRVLAAVPPVPGDSRAGGGRAGGPAGAGLAPAPGEPGGVRPGGEHRPGLWRAVRHGGRGGCPWCCCARPSCSWPRRRGKRRIAPRGGMWYNTGRNAGGSPGKEGMGLPGLAL